MKPTYASLDQIPEAFRSEYEQKDGVYVLKLEGAPPGFVPASDLAAANGRLDEFRTNNRNLMAKVAEFEREFEGIDPNEAKSLKQKLADAQKKGAGDLEQRLEAAVKPLRETIQRLSDEAKQKDEQRAAAEKALRIKGLESKISAAGLKAGVDEKALDDFVARGLRAFTLDDEGRPVAKVGDTPIYSKTKPAELMSVEEWAVGLASDAPHLFRASGGGGAAGSGKPATGAPSRFVSPEEFSRNIEDIASGKARVTV